LRFLARDMTLHPASFREVNGLLVQHLIELTKDVDVDLDAPLSPDDE